MNEYVLLFYYFKLMELLELLCIHIFFTVCEKCKVRIRDTNIFVYRCSSSLLVHYPKDPYRDTLIHTALVICDITQILLQYRCSSLGLS